MSNPQVANQTTPHAVPHPLRTVRFWLAPIVVTLAVLAGLSWLFFGSSLNPKKNFHSFPIAIVNEDTGSAKAGAKITDALKAKLSEGQQFDVRVLSADDANRQFDTAQIYGALLIPADFSDKLLGLLQTVSKPGQLIRPVATIAPNPRASAMGAGIAQGALEKAMASYNTKAGKKLTDAAAASGGAPLSASAAWVLANPLDLQIKPHNELPDGTGIGLSSYFYTLMLLIGGVTGALVVYMLVEAMLGYSPAAFGPMYRLADRVRVSWFRTLLLEWMMVAVVSLFSSAVYLFVAKAFGMPVPRPWALWLFGVFIMFAVGVASTGFMTALGTLGILTALFIFNFLGLPSTGATIPLEAEPRIFSWLAKFEPMRQVFIGTRALLYFDGRLDAGLGRSLTMTAIGLAIGMLFGAVVTWIYDRKGIHRIAAVSAPEAVAAAPEPAPARPAMAPATSGEPASGDGSVKQENHGKHEVP
ncbi:MAG: YhgE/Pip domain-containing protein [Mycobacterium sp.]